MVKQKAQQSVLAATTYGVSKMLSQGCSGHQNRSVISQTVLSKLLVRAGRNVVNVCAVCFLLVAQVVGKLWSCIKAFHVNNLLLHSMF